MPIIDKYVVIRCTGKLIKYFLNKGYPAQYNKIINVAVDDLLPTSSVKVTCTCDFCGKIVKLPYKETHNGCSCKDKKCTDKKRERTYLANGHNHQQLAKCSENKRRQTNIQKFGEAFPQRLPEIQDKIKSTNIKKYGVEYALSNKQIRQKGKDTLLQKYGVDNPLKSDDIKEKVKQTNLKKYGTEWGFQNETIKNKITNTFLSKYGVNNANYIEGVIEHSWRTKVKNGKDPISKPQKYLANLLHAELSIPCKYYCLDMAWVSDKIAIEYDGGGHNLSVKFSHISEEEFKQKEIVRDYTIMQQGWKIIRYITHKDKILIPNQLLLLFQHCKQYLLDTKHKWIHINIDDNQIQCSQYCISIEQIVGDMQYQSYMELKK